MLVLARSIGEKIHIRTAHGETIVVSVVELRGRKIRLGFEADPSIKIHREEVADQIYGDKIQTVYGRM